MKSNNILIVILLALFTCVSTIQANTGIELQKEGLEPQNIIIGTAIAGGSMYPIGLSIAEIWNDDFGDVGIRASAQTTSGAIENLDMLGKKEIHFGMLNNINGVPAWEGTGNWEGKPFREMGVVTKLYDSMHLEAVLSKFYKTGNVRDLEGLTYNVGAVGSGISFEEDLILNILGIKPGQITNLNKEQASIAIQDGRIDALNVSAAQPDPTLVQLIMSGVDIKVLNHSEEDCNKLNSIIDVYFYGKIPANTIPGITEDLPAIAQPAFLVARKDLDENLVYQLTKSLFKDPTRLQKAYSAMKDFKIETALEGIKLPLHPGAARFYLENGIEIPEGLIP